MYKLKKAFPYSHLIVAENKLQYVCTKNIYRIFKYKIKNLNVWFYFVHNVYFCLYNCPRNIPKTCEEYTFINTDVQKLNMKNIYRNRNYRRFFINTYFLQSS